MIDYRRLVDKITNRFVSDDIASLTKRTGELDGYRSILSGEDPDKPFRLPGVR